MKTHTLAAALCLLPVIGLRAQDHQPRTQIEQFILGKGSLITRQRYPLGTLKTSAGRVDLEAIVGVDEEQRANKRKGLRVTVVEFGPERQHSSFLDEEEVPALAKALERISDTLTAWDDAPPKSEYASAGLVLPAPQREIHYTSTDDFDIQFTQKGLVISGLVASGVVGQTISTLSMADLKQLSVMVSAGQQLLKSL